MKKTTIFRLPSTYREDFTVTGCEFGSGEKTCCIIGAIRGNEIQQLYMCSLLVRTLTRLEQENAISYGCGITVIPSLNPYSINIGKRYWTADNMDINNMFPGNPNGETTQRIAAAVFERVRGFRYGIRLSSFYAGGDFVPHIRMLKTGNESAEEADYFGTRYVLMKEPSPADLTTLSYNWKKSGTAAFSLYTNETERLDEETAKLGVESVLRFMSRSGFISYKCDDGYAGTVIEENELINIRASSAGIYRRLKAPGDKVSMGEVLAEIIHPYDGTVIEQIKASCGGTVFYSHNTSLILENTIAFRLIKG